MQFLFVLLLELAKIKDWCQHSNFREAGERNIGEDEMHRGEWCPKNTQEKQKFNTVYNVTAEKGLQQLALKPDSLWNLQSVPLTAETAGNNLNKSLFNNCRSQKAYQACLSLSVLP